MGVGTRRDFVVQLRSSIGNDRAVPAARGSALPHEPLEMGKRLGDRKTALRRAQLLAEERERDLVGGASFAPERGLGGLEPPPVVLDQLAGAPWGEGRTAYEVSLALFGQELSPT